METAEKGLPAADLPDESEYPSELTESWELLECFSDKDDTRTLLARNKENDGCCVVKCYLNNNVLYGRSEPEVLRDLHSGTMPAFIAEYKNHHMRCVLREYVPGATLEQMAKSRSFSEKDVRNIGLQLCDQLDTLHRCSPSVIHRDIKPQNVVLRPDGTPVLIDFGIARIHNENETDTVVYGTQGFASPEQYGFSQTDARSDIFSLGMLLHWLLRQDTRKPKENSTPLEKVIARCTAFDPDKRYADIRQVKKALLAAGPEAQKKHLMQIAAAIIVLIAAAGLLLLRSRSSVTFSEPLIEQAVRMSLGLGEKERITKDMLPEIKQIFIMADTPCTDRDSFYAEVNRWYSDGKPSRGPIRDLSDLSSMTGLEQIGIAAQEITDISVLSGLPNLKIIELKHNNITDISVLGEKVYLTSVGINDNPVRDISPLAGCPNLKFLDLCDVRSYDASVISQLGDFDFLDISNPTESYRFLDGKSIFDLRIAWSPLSDLHVLDQVTNLRELEIDHTKVTDLSPLAVHTELKVLKLTGLHLSDMSVLLQLPQLEQVIVSKDLESAVKALGVVPFTVIYE